VSEDFFDQKEEKIRMRITTHEGKSNFESGKSYEGNQRVMVTIFPIFMYDKNVYLSPDYKNNSTFLKS